MSRLLACLALAAALSACRAASPAEDLTARARDEAGSALDAFHAAASAADEAAYFDLFAGGAVFLGTDASERWSVEQFRAYAHPHFASGRGWTYVPLERHLTLAPDLRTAWFDERLENASYGECRGTGVLRREGGRWLVAQYSLSLPVPNELARDLVERIRALPAGG